MPRFNQRTISRNELFYGYLLHHFLMKSRVYYMHHKRHIFSAVLLFLFTTTLKAQLNAGMIITDSVSCAPFALIAFDNSTFIPGNPIVNHFWRLTRPAGCGTDLIVQGPSSTSFSTITSCVGYYRLIHCVTAQNGQTDCDTINNAFLVAPKPNISLTPTLQEGCPPYNPQICVNANSSFGCIDSVVLIYNDGTPAPYVCSTICSGTNSSCDTFCVNHVFSNSQNLPLPFCYSPRVIAFNNYGCFNVDTASVCLIPDPDACFSGTTLSANCVTSLNTTLTACDSGSALYTHIWRVNGITIPGATGPIFNYTYPLGCHDITHIIIHPSGCRDTLILNDYVCVNGGAGISFTSSQPSSSFCGPQNVCFTNTTAGISSIQWDLNCGNNPSPITGSSACWNVSTPGVYSLCISVQFTNGCSFDTTINNIFTIVGGFTADFTASDTYACKVPNSVIFTPTIAGAGSGCLYDWRIFGGTSNFNPPPSTNPNLTFNFTGFGSYEIELRVYCGGCTVTVLKNNYVVIQPISPIITYRDTAGCAPLNPKICQTFNIPDPIQSMCWLYPGLGIDTCVIDSCFSPVINNAPDGCNPGLLIITTPTGCIDTTNLRNICIGNPGTGFHTMTPDTQCLIDTSAILMDITLQGCVDSLFINWGDGSPLTILSGQSFFNDSLTSYTLQRPHYYNDTGTFYPFFVISCNGCRSDTIFGDTIQIFGPIADFQILTPCYKGTGTRRCFRNLASPKSSILNYIIVCGTDTTFLNNPTVDSCAIFDCGEQCKVYMTCYEPQTGCYGVDSAAFTATCQLTRMSPVDTTICIGSTVIHRNTTSPLVTTSNLTRWDFNLLNGYNFSTCATSTCGPVQTRLWNTPGSFPIAMRYQYTTSTGACYDTIFGNVNVVGVVDSFIPSDTTICLNDTICFNNVSQIQFGSVDSVIWNFGDGTTPLILAGNNAHTSDPCHIFNSPGQFQVTLTTYAAPCVFNYSLFVTVLPIVPSFIFDTIICVGAPVTFTNTTTIPPGTSPSFNWNFPGASTLTGNTSIVTNSYTSEGYFPITLSLDLGVCQGVVTDTIHIANPVACFTMSDTTAPCSSPPVQINYCSCAENDIVSTIWNFGNGQSSSSTTCPISEFYDQGGVYSICQTVTSEDGCSNTFCDTLTIGGPIVSLNISVDTGVCICDSVTFDFTLSNTLSGTFVFGCSNSGFVTYNPIVPGTIDNPDHWIIKLPYCEVDSCQPQWVFGQGSFCSVNGSLDHPFFIDSADMDFSFTTLGICNQGQVCFSDETSYFFPNANYTSGWAWNFGDGSPLNSQQNPCHTYNAPGDYWVTLIIQTSMGCADTLVKKVHIPANPNVAFQTPQNTICAGDSVCFSDISIIDSTTSSWLWEWDFGNGNFSSIQNPCVEFPNPGSYPISLCITDSLGCYGCDTLTIIVNNTPIASAGSDTTICFGSAIQLQGSGSLNYTWLPDTFFIPVNSNQVSNPVSQPLSDITYQLIVSDLIGCSDSDTVVILVSRIYPDFAVDSGCTFDTLCVQNLTTADYSQTLNWNWQVNITGGLSFSTANFCLAEQIAQNTQVILNVENEIGCTGSDTNNIVIYERPSPLFDWDSVCHLQCTPFTDLSTFGNEPIVSWRWSFGDGFEDSVQNPVHCYASPGFYSVNLEVCNVRGCCKDTTIGIQVFANPVASFNSDTVCFGLLTTLNSFSSTNGTLNIVENFWDFDLNVNGDDTSSAFGQTTYLYPSDGAHTIRLIVSDALGCSDTTDQDILVYTPPQSDFTFTLACSFSATCFSDLSVNGTNTINQWNWNFQPAAGNPTLQNPCAFYGSTTGPQTVTLVVTDIKGCKDTSSQNIVVNSSPFANIGISDNTLCFGQPAIVSDSSVSGSSPINSWAWNFGDAANVISIQNPLPYLYGSVAGSPYTITLVVSDSAGCVDTATESISVNLLPDASFTATTACVDSPMYFTNTSVPGSGTISDCQYGFWTSGPIAPNPFQLINGCNISFSFPEPGTYSVSLLTTDLNGCADSITLPVTVEAPPSSVLTPSDTTICLGSSVQFELNGSFQSITWSPQVWLDNLNTNSPLSTPQGDIAYLVSVLNGICPPSVDTAIIHVIQPIPIEVSATPEDIVLGMSSNVISQIPGQIDSIIWTPDSTLSCRDCFNPIAVPSSTTTYTATIFYSENGITCSNNATVTIQVLVNCSGELIFVPNTFTPNNDGQNDLFLIRGKGMNRIKNFRIFDRWGKLIHEVIDAEPNSTESGWNGNALNGTPMNNGVFVFSYDVECITGQIISGKGNVTLIR